MHQNFKARAFLAWTVIAISLTGCGSKKSETTLKAAALATTAEIQAAAAPETTAAIVATKWDLWRSGTQLRGANIWQKRLSPEIDGNEFGTAAVGPTYSQANLNALAAMGANYVNISFPGIYTEVSPYQLDLRVQEYLDRLLDRVEKAGLFAVISFRTGPGRDESTFSASKSAGANGVWTSQMAQDAWVSMWADTANHLRNRRIVVGYDLMVEPNVNDVLLNVYEPREFYARYRGSLYDWNPLAKRITQGIRVVDKQTPVIVGGMNWSDIYWLRSLASTGDSKTVYSAHFYSPNDYTHSDVPGSSYPGTMQIDGEEAFVDFSWLRKLLSPILAFKLSRGKPVAVNEFGAMRWQLGADRYTADVMQIFEEGGVNHALWLWETSLPINYDHFNFRFGPSQTNHQGVSTSALLKVIRSNWSLNQVRPSLVTW